MAHNQTSTEDISVSVLEIRWLEFSRHEKKYFAVFTVFFFIHVDFSKLQVSSPNYEFSGWAGRTFCAIIQGETFFLILMKSCEFFIFILVIFLLVLVVLVLVKFWVVLLVYFIAHSQPPTSDAFDNCAVSFSYLHISHR